MDDPRDERYRTKLEALCSSVSIFKRGKLFKFYQLILGFLTAQPLSKALYDQTQMHQGVARLLKANAYQRIFVFSGQMSQYVPKALLPNTVIDFCDVDSHKWENYADRMPFYISWLYRLEAHRLFAFEAAAAKLALAALFITPAELLLFRNLGGEGNILALANGVDTEFFAPRPEQPEYGRILFTGAMDYFPNEEGVTWFAKEVFPELRKKFPLVRFIIAGSNPSPKVKALARIEGVTVTGFVNDMRLEQAQAHIVVVPLRIARGMQNKVLEAMACGKAVVVCKQALGGIYAVPGQDLLMANEATDFRLCLEKLLADASTVTSMGAAARKYILTNLSWERNLTTNLLPLLLAKPDST